MINTSFILFERKEQKEIKSPANYTLDLKTNNIDDVMSSWLKDDDNIVETITDIMFPKNSNIYIIQRYIHNIIDIPYVVVKFII